MRRTFKGDVNDPRKSKPDDPPPVCPSQGDGLFGTKVGDDGAEPSGEDSKEDEEEDDGGERVGSVVWDEDGDRIKRVEDDGNDGGAHWREGGKRWVVGERR